MGRRLPGYDPDKDGPYASSARRIQIFKRIYQNMEHWRALQEDSGMSPIITTIDGEDVDYFDLMTGYDALAHIAPQQYKAFGLICLQGYTESAATKVLLPESKWSTPVQQYSDDGLKKMIAAYDEKQAGTWDPEAVKKKRRIPRRKKDNVTAVVETPEVPDDTVDQPASVGEDLTPSVRQWDWTTWSSDHESLANYITDHGVDITPQQVKAVSFLREQWYKDPVQVKERQVRKEARRAQRDKFANETPEQRRARHLAARKAKSEQLTLARLKSIQDEIRSLREQAGLDPETGEPVAQS